MAAMGSMCGTQTQLALKLLQNSAFQLSSMRTFNVCIHRSMVTKQLTFLAPLCATKQCHKLFRNGAKCCFVSPLTLACFTQGQSCTYATQSGKSLTDEILKQKLGAMSQSDASAKQPQDSASKSSGGDKKKKNEDSWFSNKNAWKLGLVSLSVMGAFLVGQLLVVWGKTSLNIL